MLLYLQYCLKFCTYTIQDFHGLSFQIDCTIIGQCKIQTADCRLQTADCRLQTADCRPGVKCKLGSIRTNRL